MSKGERQITPYWRVVKADGGLNEKLPGGVEAQAARLSEKGRIIKMSRGEKPPRVKDYEKALQGM